MNLQSQRTCFYSRISTPSLLVTRPSLPTARQLQPAPPITCNPADHLQPIACTTGPHRLQPLCSTSEARRPTCRPECPGRPAWTRPLLCRAAQSLHASKPCHAGSHGTRRRKKLLSWMQQCLQRAWRVCPNTRTTHGTGFVPQLRNILRAVVKSAFTAVFRNVFGSTANRVAAGACRVKDGYQRHSCLAICTSGKVSRNLRGTTPRTPGRYSITPSMPGTTGTSSESPAPNRPAGSAHRPRHWLDARYVDGDDDGRYRLGSLHHHGSDTGSGPTEWLPPLPARKAPARLQPRPALSYLAFGRKFWRGSRGHSRNSHGQLTGTIPRNCNDSGAARSGRLPLLLSSRSPTSLLPVGRGSGRGRAAQLRTGELGAMKGKRS